MATSTIVTVQVVGGPSAAVAWTAGMNARQAMELAQAIIEPSPTEQFTFCLQYYGSGLGYLVNMINETYDSFISRGGEQASPFFYWEFMVNGAPATQGVDQTLLNAGDEVSFAFTQYIPAQHTATLLGEKYRQQMAA